MPFCSANWKTWEDAAAGLDGAAREGTAPAAVKSIRPATAPATVLEPVKPAAGFFLGRHHRLLVRRGGGFDRAVQDLVGEALVRGRGGGAVIRIQFGANGGIGILRPGAGQQHALARRIAALEGLRRQ